MNQSSYNKQDEQAQRIAYLIAGYIKHTLTSAEHDELDAWVESSDDNMKMFEELTDENNLRTNLAWMQQINTPQRLKQAKDQLSFKTTTKKRISFYPVLSIAAVLILVMAAIYIFYHTTGDAHQLSGTPNKPADIFPAANATILTLSNGKSIALNMAGSGNITAEPGIDINLNSDQELQYNNNQPAHASMYHTLATAKGGNYHVILSDGTTVWLNAGTTIVYPATFNDSARVVTLTGEAFFEVKKSKTPFIVKIGEGETVQVLGTSFNVNAYPDEPGRSITLVQGSVQVSNSKASIVLQPGQQSVITNKEPQLVKLKTLEHILAWKDQTFSFHDADIRTIMRQLQRWYDIEVVYQSTPAHLFNATISRKEPLSKILSLLALTGKIHFKTQNKTIYVL